MTTIQIIWAALATVGLIFAALALCDGYRMHQVELYVNRLEKCIRYYAGRYMLKEAKEVLR